MSRREFMAFLAAGGMVTAAGLWMPGQKLISIPKLVIADARGRIEPARRNPSYAQVVAGMRRDRGLVLMPRDLELLALEAEGVRL